MNDEDYDIEKVKEIQKRAEKPLEKARNVLERIKNLHEDPNYKKGKDTLYK